MRIDILTLFPEMCEAVMSESIIGRARRAEKVEINCVNIRDFSGNKHNKVSRCVYPTNSASIYGICRPDWSKIEDQPTPTPTPTSTKYKVKVKTVLNVRRGPGVKYAIVDKLKNGTVVKVYEKSGNWGRIGEARWCCMTYLKKI